MATAQHPSPDHAVLKKQRALDQVNQAAKELFLPLVTTNKNGHLLLFDDSLHGNIGAPWIAQNFELTPDTPNRDKVFKTNINRIAFDEMRTSTPVNVPVPLYDQDGNQTPDAGLLIFWRRDFTMVDVGYVQSTAPLVTVKEIMQ